MELRSKTTPWKREKLKGKKHMQTHTTQFGGYCFVTVTEEEICLTESSTQ